MVVFTISQMMPCQPESLLSLNLRIILNKMHLKKQSKNESTHKKEFFEGYAPDQAELLKNAVIDIHGNYALYAVKRRCSDNE